MAKNDTVIFSNAHGQNLTAKLDYASGACRGWAIFAHCFTCSKESLAAVRIAQALAAEGIATMRVDFTGLGQSEGDFADTSFTSNMGDIAAATAWLAEKHQAPQILIGHSLGGAAVLAVASSLPSIKGVVTIGAPAEPQHVRHLFADAVADIEAKGVAELNIGGRPIRIGKGFIDDLSRHDGKASAANLKADLLVLHAPLDRIVGVENAAAIFAAAKHPKSFVSLDKADHLLTKRQDSAFAAQIISAWASRCLEESAPAPTLPPKDGGARVVSSRDGLFAHDVQVGNHRLRADEPASVPGGLDSGPGPYDFLKTGLGACTAMTVRMVAQRKGWALDGCQVTVTHRKEGEQDIFERHLQLDGALDEDQRQSLLAIANKCPVHRTLERASVVTTVLDPLDDSTKQPSLIKDRAMR